MRDTHAAAWKDDATVKYLRAFAFAERNRADAAAAVLAHDPYADWPDVETRLQRRAQR